MTTVESLLTRAAAQLDAAGIATPRVDAELLLAHTLGVQRTRLALVRALSAAQAEGFSRSLARRAAREPLQHITGRAPFRYVEVSVGPGVFVPRPETELLVDAILPALRDVTRPVVIDLCAGSGALALAVADEIRGARVVAVERPGAALEWLRRNTEGGPVEIVEADIAESGWLRGLAGAADAVISNPPYVPAGTRVAPEVRADPEVAVFAGDDGLALMPAVIARSAALLRTGGIVAIEHDESHARAVPALLRSDGRWRLIADHGDLAGRPRYVTALRA